MANCKDPAQPFPSPGSAFIPPPVPGPHEFAVRQIAPRMSRRDPDDRPPSNGTATPANGVAPGPPNGVADPPPPHDPDPPLPHHRLSSQSVTSLTSSRPAPPSPAVSRRASGFSRSSSRPASGMSTASSRPVSVQHSQPASGTTPSSPMTTTPTAPTTILPRTPVSQNTSPMPTQPTLATASALIRIRDYGFPPTDPRFTGQGPHVPRANQPALLARRLAASGSTDDDDPYDDDDDVLKDRTTNGTWEDDGTNGWGGFKWGLARAWGFGRANDVNVHASGADFPSRGDLDRNFGGEDDYEDMDIDDEPEAFSDDEAEGDADGEPPLPPGLYRALYAFEPEGTAEMKLDEDQIVRVIGRGGGVGWAVVVKDGLKDAGVHALVPESYLELVRPDGEEDG